MDNPLNSVSNLSLDSLENDTRKQSVIQYQSPSPDNVDTILVPFYEKDVLIKVRKDQKKKQKRIRRTNKDQTPINYLVNRDTKKKNRTSYLEMFRRQFIPINPQNKNIQPEIRSLSPEIGDTERDSFDEEDIEKENPLIDFYNTESYNEMFYDQILNREIENYLDTSFEESLRFTDDIRTKTPDDGTENNLRSVSEVSQPRRRWRSSAQPIQNIKLGGLGPDMEKIKPRLQRARSLQRYSEKVRMENRVKIYKKSVQADIERKAERECSAKHHYLEKHHKAEQNASYLINNSAEAKSTKSANKIKAQLKSATPFNLRLRNKDREQLEASCKTYVNNRDLEKKDARLHRNPQVGLAEKKAEVKYTKGNPSAKNKGINTEKGSIDKKIPPVQISFLVNVGGVRPSSALKTLEEKHRMYQEEVKAYTMNTKDF